MVDPVYELLNEVMFHRAVCQTLLGMAWA